jgi:O-methyltransferase
MPEFITLCPDTPPAIERALAAAPDGDYYEFGLYSGYTFWYAQHVSTDDQMRFWGFDSFVGLPKPEGVDAETKFKTGDYACSLLEVEANLVKYGRDWARTTLIKGFYDQSLTPELRSATGMKSAAVILIDCDLYASTVPVLRFMTPLLQAGTVLLFDDYNCFEASNEKGERRAFAEFLAANPQWAAETAFSFGWHGQAFVMRSV